MAGELLGRKRGPAHLPNEKPDRDLPLSPARAGGRSDQARPIGVVERAADRGPPVRLLDRTGRHEKGRWDVACEA